MLHSLVCLLLYMYVYGLKNGFKYSHSFIHSYVSILTRGEGFCDRAVLIKSSTCIGVETCLGGKLVFGVKK